MARQGSRFRDFGKDHRAVTINAITDEWVTKQLILLDKQCCGYHDYGYSYTTTSGEASAVVFRCKR